MWVRNLTVSINVTFFFSINRIFSISAPIDLSTPADATLVERINKKESELKELVQRVVESREQYMKEIRETFEQTFKRMKTAATEVPIANSENASVKSGTESSAVRFALFYFFYCKRL